MSGLTCAPCNIPESTLHLSWTGGGPKSLVWNGVSAWNTAANFALFNYFGTNVVCSAQVKCNSGEVYLAITCINEPWGSIYFEDISGNPYWNDYTCTPFYFHGLTSANSSLLASYASSVGGITDFYVNP